MLHSLKVDFFNRPQQWLKEMMPLRKSPGKEIVNLPVWWEIKVAKPFPFPRG